MAIVTKREDKRLENLRRLYNQPENINSEPAAQSIEVAEVYIPEVKVERNQLIKDLIVIGVIMLISISGYIVSRFL